MDPEERSQYMPTTGTEACPDAMEPIRDNDCLPQGISSASFLTGDQWSPGRTPLLNILARFAPAGQRLQRIASIPVSPG